MTTKPADDVRNDVRASYARVATKAESCCGPAQSGCCGPASPSQRMGYSRAELGAVPAGSDMGLGCGNPTAIASLAPGEAVLDLGCGGGFDCFLAAPRVGPEGRVIGVDMTPEMIEKARANAARAGTANVEFRLGEIEHLPVADASVDVIISNCVINLSPDKHAVFADAFRVLAPGGRLAISDIVATTPLPDGMAWDMALVSGCIGGAAPVADITAWLEAIGFADIRITVNEASRAFIADWAPGSGAENHLASATIEAVKP